MIWQNTLNARPILIPVLQEVAENQMQTPPTRVAGFVRKYAQNRRILANKDRTKAPY
jgi:hypothetical protein